VVVAWRLRRQHIESGAANQPLAQRRDQIRFIHEAAAGGVDQQRPPLHRPELRQGDHVARFRRQRRMHGNDVAGRQYLLPWCVERTEAALALVRGEHHTHAETPPNLRDPLTENALADDAKIAATEILDGEVEEAELSALLP